MVVRTWGEAREEDGLRNHVDLVLLLDLVDLEAGQAVAGARSALDTLTRIWCVLSGQCGNRVGCRYQEVAGAARAAAAKQCCEPQYPASLLSSDAPYPPCVATWQRPRPPPSRRCELHPQQQVFLQTRPYC